MDATEYAAAKTAVCTKVDGTLVFPELKTPLPATGGRVRSMPGLRAMKSPAAISVVGASPM